MSRATRDTFWIPLGRSRGILVDFLERAKMKPSFREKGVISKVEHVIGDKGFGLWLYIEYCEGSQGFGGFVASSLLPIYKKELCELFNTPNVEGLDGKECYVLRCWEDYSAEIEGIESPSTGKRITITDFLLRHTGSNKSPLERRVGVIKEKIQELDKVKEELEKQITEVSKGYVEYVSPRLESNADEPNIDDGLPIRPGDVWRHSDFGEQVAVRESPHGIGWLMTDKDGHADTLMHVAARERGEWTFVRRAGCKTPDTGLPVRIGDVWRHRWLDVRVVLERSVLYDGWRMAPAPNGTPVYMLDNCPDLWTFVRRGQPGVSPALQGPVDDEFEAHINKE